MKGISLKRVQWILMLLVLFLLIIGISAQEGFSQSGELDQNQDGQVDIDDLLLMYRSDVPGFQGRQWLLQMGKSWNTPVDQPDAPFDIGDYFILTPDSEWHYTGEGQPGSSVEDDFTWRVLDQKKEVGGGILATAIRTIADEPSDARHLDEDYWYLDPEGNLFFYGFYNAKADAIASGITLPEQDIILTDPIRIGGKDMKIGDQVTDTGAASLRISTTFGASTLSANMASTVRYVGFLPTYSTPLGTFSEVLHVVIEFQGSVSIPILGSFEFPVKGVEVYLKKGVGMIAQDQDADPDDAQMQAIDSGKVGGIPIVAQ